MSKNNQNSLLIVDDEQDLCESIHFLFEDAGYETYMANDLASAKEILQRCQLHFVVTDLRLPDGNGLELIQWVHERQMPTQMILISGFIELDQVYPSHADVVLKKPVDLKDLLAVVERMRFASKP